MFGIWSSELEIRREHHSQHISPVAVYLHKRYIPEVKRNGFKGNFHRLSPRTLFCNILSDSRMETLLKAEHTIYYVTFRLDVHKSLDDYWASIKICIRNKYTVTDVSLCATMWICCDFSGKDVQNAKFVCPIDLKAEHDRWMKKKKAWQERQKREEERKRLLKNEQAYQEAESKIYRIGIFGR